MDSAEFERLVAEIGEALLLRVKPEAAAGMCAPCATLSKPANRWTRAAVAAMIDHTLLKPEASAHDIVQLCAEARELSFASVCVNPHWVRLCAAELGGSGVKVCTVAGFPLGATVTSAKMSEAETAIRSGASEIDMVMNVGALKSGDLDTVRNDIKGVAEVCHRGGTLLKVILETCLLTDEEKETSCLLSMEAGADFVKTSTGFNKGGATVEDVSLMRRAVGPRMGVKASGGVRNLHDLKAVVEAGASRIGASASVQIVEAAAR